MTANAIVRCAERFFIITRLVALLTGAVVFFAV